jgi:hypothetical protein
VKTIVTILLFVFVSFIAAPTVMSLIKENRTSSLFFNCDEEEMIKDFKELKVVLNQDFSFIPVHYSFPTNSNIISENLSRHDNVSEEIFSPPPELI